MGSSDLQDNCAYDDDYLLMVTDKTYSSLGDFKIRRIVLNISFNVYELVENISSTSR
jgi:hypothetical protein